jgi:hypothetical protein
LNMHWHCRTFHQKGDAKVTGAERQTKDELQKKQKGDAQTRPTGQAILIGELCLGYTPSVLYIDQM